MMNESDIRRVVRDEINRTMNIILQGVSEENEQENGDIREGISQMFPGQPTITDRPVAHPYGMVSRAPRGTLSVHARQGNHVGNRIVLGHRDSGRPSVERGEVMLYNEFGQQIYLENGNVRLGSRTAANPVARGNRLTQFYSDLLKTLMTHTHLVGAVPTTPADPGAQAVWATQQGFVDSGIFESSNVLTE